MFKIRKSIFETNSSSSDYYSDGREIPDFPSHVCGRQTVYVSLDWDADVSDERMTKIQNEIEDTWYEDIINIIADCYSENDDADDGEFIEWDGTDMILSYEFTAYVTISGSYYPATRYEPAEYPDIEFDYDCVPTRPTSEGYIVKVMERLMKFFKEKGYTEIERVMSITGSDIDESELSENLDY